MQSSNGLGLVRPVQETCLLAIVPYSSVLCYYTTTSDAGSDTTTDTASDTITSDTTSSTICTSSTTFHEGHSSEILSVTYEKPVLIDM